MTTRPNIERGLLAELHLLVHKLLVMRLRGEIEWGPTSNEPQAIKENADVWNELIEMHDRITEFITETYQP